MTDKEILHRLYAILKPHRGKLLIAICMMVCFALATGAQAWLVKDVLDKIFVEKNVFFLKIIPVIVIIIFFFKGLFYYTYTILLEQVGQSVVRDFRVKIFTHIHRQSLSFFNQTPTGTMMSRIINDVSLLQQAVSNALVGVVRDVVQMVVLLGVIFYMNWQLAMVTFIVLPIAAYPIVRFGKLFRKLSTKTQEETAKLSNIIHETITGSRIVKAFSKETYEGARFARQADTILALTMKDARYRCLQHPLMEFIGGLAVAAIIWFGGFQVIEGKSTPGTFFAFLTALIAAYEPIKGVTKVNAIIQQGLAAATRIFTILDIRPEISDKADALALPPFHKEICFKNLNFSYPDEEKKQEIKVLKNLNLSVPAGEALAIVGPSGGGKTTLTNLIPRFLDIREGCGAITIDGHDIRDITIYSLRSQISVVSQQTILFNDSVRNNIAYSNPDAETAAITAAAEAAFAHDFIMALPDGYDTIIGEGGARLSGGEKQRISIARALLKDAPILILDEATSALDTESEREVQKALDNLMRNRTTFVIAHRLSTIKNAHRIIVIEDGEIVEEGTHDTLMARQGIYQQLYNIQYA